ncbi:hypothetical protein E4N62_15585 [Streptomyces sp. MNU76]|uniref:hypothetical protein n=1 Tax=Streptomyces sp. MNU76 TaxID=2560026 RepID=UPI001E426892|nr:hypothetical protein [Streptomyces sp. MNU76]MCC9706568.1 hypothetical protein [Streptomyces sp. MNU76]
MGRTGRWARPGTVVSEPKWSYVPLAPGTPAVDRVKCWKPESVSRPEGAQCRTVTAPASTDPVDEL